LYHGHPPATETNGSHCTVSLTTHILYFTRLKILQQTSPPPFLDFWATIYKMVSAMPSDHCLSVLPVCDIDVLWQNGWMD